MKKRSCLETTSFNFGCALWQHWTETRLVFSLAVTQNLLRAPLIIGAWYYFARFMFDVFYVMLCGELAEGSKASWMTTPPLQGCMREIASLGHSGYRDATPEWPHWPLHQEHHGPNRRGTPLSAETNGCHIRSGTLNSPAIVQTSNISDKLALKDTCSSTCLALRD